MNEPRESDSEPKEPFFEPKAAAKMPWMIGLFDVLGFSQRIATDGAEKVFSDYKTLIESVVKIDPMRCLGLARWPGESVRVPALFTTEVRYTYFSDTILLWLPLHPLFAGPFVQRCSDLICEALQMGIPLRGTIALGEGFMHKQSGTFLGSHIVEAARLEAAQNWIGVAFAPSATWGKFMAELSPTQITEYEIPVKDGKEDLRSPIALDWPRRWRESKKPSLQDKLRQLAVPGNLAIYYNEAIAFADWSEKHHNWHERSDIQNRFKHLRMRLESELVENERSSEMDTNQAKSS